VAGALPNLIVIGAAKCGTSALHYYLDLHPEIAMSSPKELAFFCDRIDPSTIAIVDERELAILRTRGTWSRGRGWYASQFDAAAPIRGEATPRYTAPWHPLAAARMLEVVPEVKLVFCVRDPVDRMVSQWADQRAVGLEWRALEEALSVPDGLYASRSRYARCLSPYLERFPASNLHVVRQEDLLHRRRETLAGIFRFLGVDDSFWSSKMERRRHVTAGKDARRGRLMWRLQRVPGASRIVRSLPQEAKWHMERLGSATAGREEPRSTSDSALRARLLEELADDVTRFRAETGVDPTAVPG
jgi:hypothetical protein